MLTNGAKTLTKKRVLTISLLVFSILLVLVVVAGIVAGNVFLDIAQNPTSKHSMVANIQSQESPLTNENTKSHLEWLCAHSESRLIPSDDGMSLHVLWVKNETGSNKWAVLFHGFAAESQQTAEIFSPTR